MLQQWQIDALNDESCDALDHVVACNPDTIMAQAIDPVAYWETDACATLDDEIENWDRVASCMPFGGEDQPIRGSWRDD